MIDQKKHEKQRDFERFPLDFLVEVTGLSQSGKAFSDIGKMSDISGGGLCFSTVHSGWYAVGQKVAIQVYLPGTDELDASMASDGIVVWVHCPDWHKDAKAEKARIGMAVDGCMSFETRRLPRASNQPEDAAS